MAQTVLREPATGKDAQSDRDRAESRERIIRESAERYRRSVNEVNRSRDSDIEKALRARG